MTDTNGGGRVDALIARIDRKGPDDCWHWKGCIDRSHGYGLFYFEGSRESAHRASYKAFNGPIQNGLTIDHLCRVRDCVNPKHLEAVTIKENILRGVGLTAKNRVKTHCLRGHAFSQDNLLACKYGWRKCKACHLRWKKEKRARAM